MKKISLFIFSFLVLFSCREQIKDGAGVELSSNNKLVAISFTSSVEEFDFSPSTYSYNVKLVNSDVEKIGVSAIAEDEKAIVEISPSGLVSIDKGGTVSFTIKCKAVNGNEKKTTIRVLRASKENMELPSNAFLKTVRFSKGEMLIEFDKLKTEGYVVILDENTSNTSFSCVPEDENAKVEIVEEPKGEVAEGGEKTYKAIVTAQDNKTIKTYVFTVRRKSSEQKAELIDIIVGKSGVLKPSFKQDVLTYEVSVPNEVDKISVRGIPLNKNTVVTTSPNGDVNLVVGVKTTFTITATLSSQNRVYTVNVLREQVKDKNAFLTSLVLKGDDGAVFPIEPSFNKNTKSYNANIYKNYEGILNLEATPEQNTSSFKVFSSPSILGSNIGDSISLKCVVTAEAGNQETYTVVATRKEETLLSTDATLKELLLETEIGEQVVISPQFVSTTLAYTAKVPFHFKSKVKPKFKVNHKKANASYKAEPQELKKEGGATQVFTIEVVAEDNITKNSYIITLKRDVADEDTNLKSLKLKRDYLSDDVSLTPEFNTNITEYTAEVPRTTGKVRFVWERTSTTSVTEPAYPMEWVDYRPTGADNSMTLTLKVIAQSGASKTYSVRISSPKFDDKYLKMVDVIKTPVTVVGSGTEGVFVQGRTITVQPYKMSECEITYSSFMHVKQWADNNGFKFSFNISKIKKGSQNEEEDEPVCGITWKDAIIWCNAYSVMQNKKPCYTTKDGKELKQSMYVDNDIKMDMNKSGYRLPTEIEWEFAARGGNPNEPEWNYKYAGVDGDANKPDDRDRIGEFIWHRGNSKEDGNSKTHKPKLKKPTNHGKSDDYAKIYDMCGNVSEWVWDRAGVISADTPIDGNADGTKRILRGYFCFNLISQGEVVEIEACKVTNRNVSNTITKSSAEMGFRIVCK